MSFKFTNKALETIHAEAEKEISTRLSQLDAVSADIKTLEQVLSKAAISMKYTYCYLEKSDERSYGVETTTTDTTKSIVWNPDEKRLYHEVHAEKITSCMEGFCRRDDELQEFKPLIETKAEVRLKIKDELPSFFEQIMIALKESQGQERVRDFSPLIKLFKLM